MKDKETMKFETIISGAEVGNKIFTGEILEGRLVDDKLSVTVSTNMLEEIVVEGSFTVYVKMKDSIILVAEVVSLIE